MKILFSQLILLLIGFSVVYKLWVSRRDDGLSFRDVIVTEYACFKELSAPTESKEKTVSVVVDITDIPRTVENVTKREFHATRFLKGFGELNRNRFFSLILSHIEYDYSSIRYPIPFKTLVNDMSVHYVRFELKNSILPEFVYTGFIPTYSNQRSDVLVMTGASDNHGLGSFNCMYSVILADPYASILYIDYGLSPRLLSILSSHFKTLHQIQLSVNSDGFLGYRKYQWKSFPDWMHLSGNEQRGGYSWKMVAVHDAFFEWKGMLVWFDGGNVVVDGLSRELTAARRYGVYSPFSADTIGRWVHKDMRQFAQKHKFVKYIKKHQPMASGGVLFIDYSKSFTRKFVEMLTECCYTQSCVAPKRASMSNHRQDQSILSMLLYEFRVPRAASEQFDFHPSLRNDGDNDEQITGSILNNLFMAIQNTYNLSLDNQFYNTTQLEWNQVRMKWVSRKLYN